MSMFDIELVPFAEAGIMEGQIFTLEAIRVGPTIPTVHGERTPALLTIGGKEYALFGDAIVSQAQRADDGELPARVKIIRRESKTPGQSAMKIIVPASHEEPITAPQGQPVGADDDIPF